MKVTIDTKGIDKVEIEGRRVSLTKGNSSLSYAMTFETVAEYAQDKITLSNDNKKNLHTDRAILKNNVSGLNEPWSNNINLQGTGYKMELSVNLLTLYVGYSSPVRLSLPDLITIKLLNPTSCTFYSPCKQTLGDFIARLEKIRPVNRYKGFGIRNGSKTYVLKNIKKK